MFEILSSFDWITPTIGIAETLWHGPFSGHTFFIPLDGWFSGAQCESILEEYGISIYARCIAHGDAFFTVEKDRAQEAERVLLQAGVTLLYSLFSRDNAQYLGR